MKPIPLTAETAAIARRLVWFESPEQALAGLEVPLKLRGPWERIEVTPDVSGLLKDPDKAVGALKDIGKQLKGKNPDEIVDQVLASGEEQALESMNAPDRKVVHDTVAEMDGEVVGWGSLSKFRDRAAYDPTVEASVYIRHDNHRRGLGRDRPRRRDRAVGC